MRVLWFTNIPVQTWSGSGGGWMRSLQTHLAATNACQLTIASRSTNPAERVVGADGTTYINIPEVRSKLRRRLESAFDFEPVAERLQQHLRVIQETEPDVVQVFGTELDYGLVCTQSRVPVIIHLQGILSPYLYVLERTQPTWWTQVKSQTLADYLRGSTVAENVKTFRRRSIVEKNILASCSYVLGRTKWDKSLTSVLAPNAKYFRGEELLHQCFAATRWQGHASGRLRLVSTLSNPLYKGHELVIASAKILRDMKIDFEWSVIGVSSGSLARKIYYGRSRSSEIILHDKLTPQQVAEKLASSSIYVHPSHVENSSNSICEAMSIGMPVVALDVGGNSSMIEDGRSGLVVPDNDPFSLAAAINRIAADPTYAEELGQCARRQALERHKPDRVVSELIQTYRDVIEESAI